MPEIRDRTTREGSATKRQAILDAARELFVALGVDRVSMDAVSARAGVSKRTVYDYFGDKGRLLTEVVTGAAESLMNSVRGAVGQHLSDDAGIETVAGLEEALTAFALEIGTTVVASADYATVFTLAGQQREHAEALDRVTADAPEEAVAERLAHFGSVGLLDVADPRLAADHFSALTVLLAYNDQPDPAAADLAKVRRTMVDGVHAFIRAYGAR
jgi:TetR/AcrR family transcriptional repressor of mexJK operon